MEKANTVGDKIRLLRKKNKLTQQQLAELIGVSAISIRKYESGDRQPSQTTLKVIADVFEVKPGIFNDLLELSLTNVNEYHSEHSIAPPDKIGKWVKSFNNYNVHQRIISLLALYGHKATIDETNNIILINDEGIKINLSDNDIKTLDDYMRFALSLKLEEILNTKEGE